MDRTELYRNCRLCPRECKVDRRAGKTGFCGMTSEVMAARAALHFWEEPCISGTEGSGAVFFSGCTLRCVFCQNHEIAAGAVGKPVTEERLSRIFLELQEKGANNINLVTATQFLPTVIPALQHAKKMGLTIPIVYNTGGYEKVETLRLLEELVNIWLPDCKYRSAELAARYSRAADYPETVKTALAEMVRQTGAPMFDRRGMMKKGVIVRHLVLPGCVSDSKDVLEYLWDTFGNQIYVSIMSQYTPLPHVAAYPEINRKVTDEEYEEIVDYARFLGMSQVYIQEGGCVGESFIPPFNYEGIERNV
ncbi:MAG: radical SAM protein [Lachnospiraceae bacterium]|nr:radical SAM protein [Clostridiaceae bacterium]MDY3826139.1 radical SAM protein [Lachnospiraceae bacterium]